MLDSPRRTQIDYCAECPRVSVVVPYIEYSSREGGHFTILHLDLSRLKLASFQQRRDLSPRALGERLLFLLQRA